MSPSIKEIRELGRKANELLLEIGRLRLARTEKETRLNARVDTLKKRYGPEIDLLKKREDATVEELVKLVVPNFFLLAAKGTKTIKLRAGDISRRLGAESLVVSDDEATVIRRIAKRGGLRRFTRVGKRTLNRDALKAAPAFVADVRGLSIERKETLVIRPARARVDEIKLDADKLSVPLPQEDD